MTIAIEPASRNDLPELLALLAASGLPGDGLGEDFTAVVARQDGQLAGGAALELYGAAALLRSVVVAPALRGRRLGDRLVRGALRLARRNGVAEVYLLTETAAQFFPRFGFVPIARSDIAPAVQQSIEFTSACPASAQAMRLVLAPHARAATLADAEAIARIYNQGIEDRVGTFETRLRTAEDIRGWFDGAHPIVVVQDAGEVAAFASTSTYRPRECYAGIAEFSVYVAREQRGRGLGRLAMRALLAAAEAAGFWKLVSRVFVENTASRALLGSLGFREVGIYAKHGQLDGAWRDVVIVERLIDSNLAQ
jgi:phosphinothricin acetyltransferase